MTKPLHAQTRTASSSLLDLASQTTEMPYKAHPENETADADARSTYSNALQPSSSELRRAMTREESILADYVQLTKSRQQDIRAEQRTFEGAYIRTALGQMTFSLMIAKMFNREYAPIGMVFIVYSLLLILISIVRGSDIAIKFLRKKPDTESQQDLFHTSGYTVLLTGILSLVSYVALLVIILTL